MITDACTNIPTACIPSLSYLMYILPVLISSTYVYLKFRTLYNKFLFLFNEAELGFKYHLNSGFKILSACMRADLSRRQCQGESLAGVAHLSKFNDTCNTGVLRQAW